jgi:hypothetical protein
MSDPRPPYDPYGRRDPAVAEAVHRRDQGRRRVTNTTLWALVAAAAGATVLGAGYANAIPGVSDSSTGTPSTAPSDSSSPDSSGGLQAPSQAPAPTTEAPQTQSGAS